MSRREMPKPSSFTRFSFKSAIFMMFGLLLASLAFPLLLDSLGLKLYYLRVLVFGLTTGFTASYSIFIRDSNKGYTKGFWITFVLLTLLGSFISYFWVFNIYPV